MGRVSITGITAIFRVRVLGAGVVGLQAENKKTSKRNKVDKRFINRFSP
jgi:hypothetical protein